MSLYGALFSGVSGLQAQSSAMGAISDNVTNVNTVGYKNTTVNFQTLVTQQASSTQYSAGGVQSRPRTNIDAQGLLQGTTRALDVAISGNGFFVVNEAGNPGSGDIYAYSRAGSFDVDRNGYLVNTGGYFLQGWPLQTWDGSTQASTNTINDNAYMKAYQNDSGDTVYINDNVVDNNNLRPLNLREIGGVAVATTSITASGNLNKNAPIGGGGDLDKTNILMYDSLGTAHNLEHRWHKRDTNQWDFTLVPPYGSETVVIEDQSSDRNNYMSLGRLDFENIPDVGSSMDLDIGGTNYTIDFTSTTDDNAIVEDFIDFGAGTGGASDGDTITVTIGGVTRTFEFDSDSPSSVTGTNIAVTIAQSPADPTETATNLAATIESTFDDALGRGDWARADGNGIYITNTSGSNNDSYSVSIAAGNPLGVSLNGGAAATEADNTLVDPTPNNEGGTAVEDFLDFGAGAVDGDVITITLGGITRTFEFDSDSDGAPGSDVAVTIAAGASAADTAAALQAAVEATFDGELGAGDWARTVGTRMYITNVPGSNNDSYNVDIGAASTLQVSLNGGAQQTNGYNGALEDGPGGSLENNENGTHSTNLQVSTTGKSLSQIMDDITARINSILQYEFGGVPALASPPNSWAERISGENSLTFHNPSTSDLISVDATNLRRAGVSSVMQNSVFTLETLGASTNWISGADAIVFNGDGSIDRIMGLDETQAGDPRIQYKIGWANGSIDMDGATSPAISVDFGDYNKTNGFTQFNAAYQTGNVSQNGQQFGNFAGLSIGKDGVVTALFDNGVTRPIFMIPIATLGNPNGMSGLTGNVFIETNASGQPIIREAGSAGAGTVNQSAVEASTVDLGAEFTTMITTQRAYSASSKIISTADEMLEELLRVKR